MRFIVAFYEVNLAWGGPEEGGWYYPTGRGARAWRVCRGGVRAAAPARRAHRLLDRLQRRQRDVGSVLYNGGRFRACVFEGTAPADFPEVRPHYE